MKLKYIILKTYLGSLGITTDLGVDSKGVLFFVVSEIIEGTVAVSETSIFGGTLRIPLSSFIQPLVTRPKK